MVKVSSWWVYIIEARNGHLYTGITTDVERRFKEHQSNKLKGARYFRGNPPVAVRYQEASENRSEASKREAAIKKLSRKQKLALIASDNNA